MKGRIHLIPVFDVSWYNLKWNKKKIKKKRYSFRWNWNILKISEKKIKMTSLPSPLKATILWRGEGGDKKKI